ncbi:MAG: UDP-3-O-(3-hydroxymyristoyl)glucosamine N-acyltransferase [Candidatus Aminicenantes bacterium RBG_16_63_16]|nr:MAG: UDP-3-O-(3-hydroxymyristoyl)glucosamine N-acyltransferase [Candidatus Aminicenantes bacterium RBG_16_63_16]
MPKPFEDRTPPPALTVRELAERLGCRYEGDGDALVRGVASLEDARPGDLVFLGRPKYRRLLEGTKASAVIVPPDESFRGLPVLIAEDPHLAFVRAVELFFEPYRPEPGIHPTALVSGSAEISGGVSIGAFSVIGDKVRIGEGTVIFPLVCIYPGAAIGEGTVIHSHVSIREGVRIGCRVIIHNGAVIGADGFGYIQLADGSHKKIPQKGTVVIEDDVEVGANAAIDRAALGETVIRRGVKIDNLVQVAHNVEVGENSILAGQTGLSGSVKIGRGVLMGGQVGVADHVRIGDNAIAAGKSGITKDVPAGAFVSGSPHLDVRDWRKAWVLLPRLYDFVKDVKRLKTRVEELERRLKDRSAG